MGTFKSSKTLFAQPSMIPTIAAEIVSNFTNEGYEVESQELISGGYDISITKGGVFKAVLGMKSALKVGIQPQGGNIFIEAGVGIFGQQAIPTVISMFFLWPVLLTQIWGMIEQSKLDDRVIEIAETVIVREKPQTGYVAAPAFTPAGKFCTQCGKRLEADAIFCSGCGEKL